MSEESIFINRELSWLDFNRRVLVLGKDKNVPLAEQLKFLAIYGSNLDEFFMVRVGSLQERANLMRGKKEKRENKTNMTAEEQLAAIMPKTAQLQEDCDKYYVKALENLAACGYRKVDFDKLSKEDEHFWKKYFQSELFPILSPQIVDSRHPFPFLRNKEIYLGVLLHEKHTSEHTLGIVPISSQMERMHFVRKDNETCFALTEELVLHYAALIFGKENVQEKCLFRVTRNADIDVKEGMMDHDIDYREIMADLLKRRRKLAAVRLQVIPAAPQVAQLLCSRLELTHKRVFVQKGPLDLSFFYKLTSRMESDGHPELFYTPARPMLPPQDYDLAAEVVRDELAAVADAEHGHARVKERGIDVRRVLEIHAVRAADEDEADGIHREKVRKRRRVGLDLAVNAAFAHAARDELIVLAAKVQHDHGFMLHDVLLSLYHWCASYS